LGGGIASRVPYRLAFLVTILQQLPIPAGQAFFAPFLYIPDSSLGCSDRCGKISGVSVNGGQPLGGCY